MKLNLVFPNIPDSQSDDCSTRVAKDKISDVKIVSVTYLGSKMTL